MKELHILPPVLIFFVACFNSFGGIDWVRIVQSSNGIIGNDLFIDNQDNIYVTGMYNPNDTINQTVIMPSWGSSDILYAKLCNPSASISTDDILKRDLITVCPNPANSTITIFPVINEKITVSNLLGEIVMQKNFSNNPKDKVELDVSFLSPGIYIIKVIGSGKNYCSTLVKE